jgi:S1-C subfamily serine protease
MKTRHKRFIGGAVLAAIFSPGAALAQSDSLEKQMDVVVKLRIHRAIQSTEETAAGLFVGKDRQNAYFITACHAVIQDDARVQSVQLQFRSSPQGFKALVFERYDPVLDLAVVQVPVADLPQDLPEIVRKDAALGVAVHVIGHPSAGDWSVASGAVQNMNTPAGDIHHFTTSRDNSLAEGHSGGPVFDALGGFLGMHTASGSTYGIEAKSAEIVNQLAAWHVPTNNLTTVAAGPPEGGVGNQQAEREAINRVIDTYADSYNRRDAKALWRVWPNPPAQTKQAIEAYFQSARSITMRVIDRRIESSGANATVMAQSSQEFIPRNGSPQKSPDSPITLELEKRSGDWLIHLVR